MSDDPILPELPADFPLRDPNQPNDHMAADATERTQARWAIDRAGREQGEADLFDTAVSMLADARIAEQAIAAKWTDKLPKMTTRNGIRRYVSVVTHGVTQKSITGAEARVLLYAAQLALSTIRGEQKKKRKPGRPRKNEPEEGEHLA